MARLYWLVRDAGNRPTEIMVRHENKEVIVTSSNSSDGEEVSLSYTQALLDDYIAALTEARRAIS